MKQLQHGDVLIEEITELPEGLIQLDTDIVMAGEATGHHHRVQGKVQVLECPTTKDIFLNVVWPSTITHEEHKPIDLPTGTYKIGRVQEYDYYEEQARLVVD